MPPTDDRPEHMTPAEADFDLAVRLDLCALIAEARRRIEISESDDIEGPLPLDTDPEQLAQMLSLAVLLVATGSDYDLDRIAMLTAPDDDTIGAAFGEVLSLLDPPDDGTSP